MASITLGIGQFGSKDPFGLYGGPKEADRAEKATGLGLAPEATGAPPTRRPADGADGAISDSYYDAIRTAESGGNDAARNPRSSATGRYQFTKGTWARLAEKYPELGLTAEGRLDPAQQERAIRVFTEENAQSLKAADLAVDNGSLYAAHFLGARDATRALSAGDDIPMNRIVSSDVIKANPFLDGMTAKEFRSWAARKAGGTGAAPASTSRGVVVDAAYKPSDPMGIYAGGSNPLARAPAAEPPPQQPTAPQDDGSVDRLFSDLESREPGRYRIIDEAEHQRWQEAWEAANRSDGLLGDAARLLGSGFAGVELAVREAIGQIPVIGQPLQQVGDAIDRWMTGQPNYERRLQGAIERYGATLTPETAAAREKVWWDDEKGRLGDAWLDPRAYFAGVVESLPGTAVTMVPSMALARGAYLAAMARGASSKVAAAAAARSALISGAVLEGGLGGGQAAQAVRSEIAAMPREQLASSHAVQALVSSGMSEDEAIAALSDDAATQAFVMGGAATGLFGGFGDRMLARILAEGVGGGIARRIGAGAARGVVAEGVLEEAPQEALGQAAQNLAIRNTVDPSRGIGEGVTNAALGGAAVGGTMGAGMGAAGGALAPQRESVPAQPPRGPLVSALDHAAKAAPGAVVDAVAAAQAEAETEGESPTDAPQSAPTAPRPDPGAPQPGQRVIVSPPGGPDFTARLESIEETDSGPEAVIIDDNGEVLQVPAALVSQRRLTDGMIEAMEREESPPLPPTDGAPPADPLARTVGEATMLLPDENHAGLYDFAMDRRKALRMSRAMGESALRARDTNPERRAELADAFGVPVERVSEIADDYLVRVMQRARRAKSALPQRMHGLNAERLKGWQAERKAADQAAAAASAPSDDDLWEASAYPDDREEAAETLARGAASREAQGEAEASKPGANLNTGGLDALAHEAATSPSNALPEPTPAQKEAGNYRKGHVALGGLDISIENPAGSARSGTDRTGKPWSVTMKAHYGYIRGTEGRDKDHIDVFVRRGADAIADTDPVFVVDQVNPDGSFDEHKVMLGYKEPAQARRAYLANYAKGWKGLGTLTPTTLGDLKTWLKDGNTRERFAPAPPASGAKPAVKKITSPVTPPPPAEPAPAPASETEQKVTRVRYGTIKPGDEDWQVVEDALIQAVEITRGNGDRMVALVRRGLENTEFLAEAAAIIGTGSTSGGGKAGPRWDAETRGASVTITLLVPSAPVRVTLKGAQLAKMLRTLFTKTLDEMRAETAAAEASSKRKAPPRIERYPVEPDQHEIVGQFNQVFDWVNGLDEESYVRLTAPDEFQSAAEIRRQILNSSEPLKVWGFMKQAAAGRETPPPEHPGLVVKRLRDGKERLIQPKGTSPDPAAAAPPATPVAPAWGADNTFVTRDRAEEVRRRLKDKLKNQLGAGIDPEILALGAELAAFHIEAGARRFADFARAVASDLGSDTRTLRPYLRAWYNGARDLMEDAGRDISGTDDPEAVRAALATLETPDEPRELDPGSPPALEGAPSEPVSGPEGGGTARAGAETGGGADLPGDERTGGLRVPAGRGMADGARALPDPAGGGEPAAVTEPQSRDVAGGAERPADDGNAAPVQPQADADRRVDYPPSEAKPAATLPADFAISDADAIGKGGAKTKFRANLAAIRLLRQLEDGHRSATRDEQAVLAKWVGWGGLSAAFPREDGSVAKGWEKEAAELRDLLSEDEYRAAAASTRNAHYTSPEVVGALWSIARRLGFTGGRVLEPSVGAGNFLGLMPPDLRAGTHVTGVELDRITGGIARNLYPGAAIHAPIGFQEFAVPDGHFDLAIGNPPFGSEKLYDRERRNLNKFSIHNFFFAKSMDALRPGGLLAMVVTNSFLDATNFAARHYLARQADLVGAIRLPNTAFLGNAGTEVTTDIIVLRKRRGGEPRGDDAWVAASGAMPTITDRNGKSVPVNPYFVANPGMMLGEFGAFGTMYRKDAPALISREGQDLAADLERAISTLPRDLIAGPGTMVAPETVAVATDVEGAAVGSLFLAPDGAVMIRRPDRLGETQAEAVDLPNEKAKSRVAGMIRVRDALARLRRAQLDEAATDAQIETLRKRLNTVYDAFVGANGPINADANKRLFRDDPTWPQIAALEDGFDKGLSDAMAKRTGETPRPPSAKKAPIFSRRTQAPYRPPTAAKSAKDALAAVLSEHGRIDMAAMQRLYPRSEEAIVDELGALIYPLPGGGYDTADAYLSGNVKAKLAEAQRVAATKPAFRRNVAALESVLPADIEPVDIDVKAGAPWVPAEHVTAFLAHVTGRPGGKAVYNRAAAQWVIEVPGETAAAAAQWGTDRAGVDRVLDAALNARTLSIYDKAGETNVLNQAATDAANAKVEAVKAEWRRWLWDDDDRRVTLARLYNDAFNTDVIRTFDGSHLTLPGKVGDDIIALRPHQMNFVWRVLQSGTSLADHTVGAGKTFAVIASVMELRRTGLARKPMVVVPNHLVGQWAADFLKLYPGAKILAPTKADFEKERRKTLFARVATGDWDAVIVAHSSFGRIGVDAKFEAAFIQQQVDDLESSIVTMRTAMGAKSRSVKQLEKARETMSSRLQRLLDAGGKDDGLTFDEMGIDALVVDEAHEFKNLGFATSMTRVAGLGNTQGSQKAADLYMKVQSVLERTGGRNIVFATGTPLSNTMAEMYTLQRYLDFKALRDAGVAHFDAWARVFGEVVTDWELAPSGQYRLNSRFAKFVNMPELMQRYLSFADVITNDDIQRQLKAIGKTLPLPKVKGGKPQNVVVDRSRDQARFIGEPIGHQPNGQEIYPRGSLVWRAENLPKKQEKGADNMLKVMSDARKAALDMRLIDPALPDAKGSKVHVAADNIKRVYDRWSAERGTQLVFIDLSTPSKARAGEEKRIRDLEQKAAEGDEAAAEALERISPDEMLALGSKFSVYDDLRDKLVARGIPATEIAFIHDANTEAQKEELFGKVRSGRVRVLFGSTPKMGAGTNVQNRLVALHHLDAPWRPSDLEQRDGRGIRQGNELYAADPDGFEIEILRYATKNTLDARQWQTIEGKARFIAQMRKGDVKARVIEDIAGEAANAAEMKAAASGNPLILEEMDLRQKLRRLEGAQSEHERAQHQIKWRLRMLDEDRQRIEAALPDAEADASRADAVVSEGLNATVDGASFDKPSEMGAAIIAAARSMMESTEGGERTIGDVGGFAVKLANDYGRRFTIILEGRGEYHAEIEDIDKAVATGVGMRVVNVLKTLPKEPARMNARLAEIGRDRPALEKQLGAWPQAQELVDTNARHAEVLAKLQPRQQPAPAVVPPDAQASANAVKPVIKITGEELGVPFHGRPDMPLLWRAAAAWYDANLRGTTATMGDGTPVTFSRKGQGKSTSAGKGDVLLRSVPAIRAIVEKGRIVHREPGNRPGVLERIVIAAPVDFMGTVHQLAVSVHRTTSGQIHYDFTFNREESSGTPGMTPGGAPDVGSLPSLDVPRPADLNLVEWRDQNKAPEGWDVVESEPRWLDEAVRQELVDIVRQAAGLDKVGFAGRITIPAGNPGWNNAEDSTAAGFYSVSQDAIVFALDSATPHAAWHEAFHRLQQLFLTDRERAILRQERGRLRRIMRSSEARRDQADRMAGQELEAEAFAMYAMGQTKVKPHKAIAAVWDRMAAMLRRLRNFLAGHGFATSEDVFAAAQTGSIAQRAPVRGPKGATVFDKAYLANPPRRTAAQMKTRAIEEIKGAGIDAQPGLLKLVPLNYFTELARPGMTAVREYLRLKRDMDAYRGNKHGEADAIAQEWLKFSRLGYGLLPSAAGQAQAERLASLMHDSTLSGIDPSATDKETRERPGYQALRKRFLALPRTGRDLYVQVRDSYEAQALELDRILLENVRKAQEIGRKKAQEAYEAEIARIEAAGLEGEAERQATEQATAAHANAMLRSSWAMKARTTKLRQLFERTRAQKPYFPLARFGRYFVTVRDIDGTVLSFSRREKAAERDRLARDLRAAYPNAKVEVGVLDGAGAGLKEAMDPRMVAEIEEILGGAGVDPDVMDQIWQRYLETMPDLSTRKRFIHRKGTAGFEGDALRAFSSHMFHAAHQMARLKYGLDLQEMTNQATEQARKADDPTRAMTLANALKERHDWVMNPTGSRAVQWVTSMMFAWHLAATPAAAIVNLTQTPMMMGPILSARFGAGKSSAALVRAARDFAAGRGSVLGGKGLTAEERFVFERFYQSGLIDRTQSHDLAGVGDVGVTYSPLRARVMAGISWMFHKAEVANREVSALAAYRLARAAGQSAEAATDTAHDLVWKAHFDYANSSRASVMQGDAAKLLFVFQNHQLNMWYRLMRDMHQSFKGATPQARKEARYQLAGIMGMMSLMGGVTGLFGYNVLMALAGALLDDEDDPRAFKEEMEGHVTDLLGPDLGAMVLKGVPGRVLGIDLNSRLGMPDFFVRAPDNGAEGRDWFKELVIGVMGVVPSTAINLFDGLSVIGEGNVARGVEIMAPKPLKDLMQAFRYANEGVTSRRGDQVLARDQVSAWDVIAEIAGFTPARVAETYERNGALKDAEQRVLDERRELMNRFALAVMQGDDGARKKALEAIRRWNGKSYARRIPITADGLRQSLRTRARNAAKREDGVLISNEALGRYLRDLMPERVY